MSDTMCSGCGCYRCVCWKNRESERFRNGTYKPVPVTITRQHADDITGCKITETLDYPSDHYLHLSTTVESDVAYTPSPEYGERDRQIHLKFGRYLKKVWPEMTEAEIQSHVTSFKSALSVASSPATLNFATDRDKLNGIFETRMRACGSDQVSCMYGKFTDWDIRPYHVYADSPDVAVAYVTARGEIVSRSVVSTKDKTWVRAYSRADGDNDADCGTLKSLLRDAGYSKGELYGNRLTKLPERRNHGVLLPYLDNGGAHVEDIGEYWRVREDGGDYECDCTDGTATELDDRDKCSTCDEPTDECECSWCDCCQENYRDECDICSMCEHCECCTYHDDCSCGRCSECHELVEEYRHCSHCTCDRCSECNALESECECDKCPECDELDSECTCDKCDECEELTEHCTCEAETASVPVVTPDDTSLPLMTRDEIRQKLNRIWVYLREQGGYRGYEDSSDAMNAIKYIFDNETRLDTVETEREMVTA